MVYLHSQHVERSYSVVCFLATNSSISISAYKKVHVVFIEGGNSGNNYQVSCNTLLGVHSTMHLVGSKKCVVAITCTVYMYMYVQIVG